MMKSVHIMTKDVITISPNSSLIQAARLMAAKSVSSLVVTKNDMPIAIVEENDIIRGLVSKKKKASDIMSRDFASIPPSTSFSEINKSVKEENIKRFTVVEDKKLIGLITETDIIEAIRDFTRFNQILQEAILAIFGLATAFFLFYFSPIGVAFFG